MTKIRHLILFFLFFYTPNFASAKVVSYHIDIDYEIVNYTGEDVQAMVVGGGIPAPTIEAHVGDTLRVTFTNKMDVETSIHWHGVLLPNDQDGVPYLTTDPIKAGTSFTYEYPITHHGTYWYHSHTGLQEQRGVYGALVFHPQEEAVAADHDQVLVLSDWTDENPKQVLANLKKDGDFYALKKDSVQSWLKVVQHGKEGIQNRLQGSWTRMGPMDVSDVGYDAFLVNGQKEINLSGIMPGQKLRLRLVNAAASSYFNVEFAGGDMVIVAADGVDVKSYTVDRLRMAIAETFDIIVEVPDEKRYELRVTAEDGTGYSSTFIGQGKAVYAQDIPKPNPFIMDHSMHGMDHSKMDHAKMGHHEMLKPKRMQEYEGLQALTKTVFSEDNPTREVVLELTGNMERYVWTFNNKTLREADKILIKKGENVRFKLVNQTMMHHPIHLHGHFFRVLNGQGDYSPLKHTVNVPPMAEVEIEFYANEEKDWFFHCHNLYHMKTGMSRVISYGADSELSPYLKSKLAHDQWYFSHDIMGQTNMVAGMFRSSNTRNAIELEYDNDYEGSYEFEVAYERSITRFLDLFIGGNFEKEEHHQENIATAGVHYVLPLLIESELRFDSDGNVRLGLGSELQLTDRTAFEWEWNTDTEYRFVVEYELSKRLSLSANYDSDYYAGAGITLKF